MQVAIIDGGYLTYRTFKAGGQAALFRHTVTVFLDLLQAADHVWVAWDPPCGIGPELRRQIYGDYKSRRGPKEQEYLHGLPAIHAIAYVLGVGQVTPEHGEGDDAAYSLLQTFSPVHHRVQLWTRDKDWLQMLTRPGTSVLLPALQGLGTTRELWASDVEDHIGVPVELVTAYLALAGDTSDDVPGMPQVGSKRAVSLLRACPTLVDLILAGRGDDAVSAVMAVDAGLAPHAARCADNAQLLETMLSLVQLHHVPVIETPGAFDRGAAEQVLRDADCGWAVAALNGLGGDDWSEGAVVEPEPVDDWSE